MSASAVRAACDTKFSIRQAVARVRAALEEGRKGPAPTGRRVPALYKNMIVRAVPHLARVASGKKREQPIRLLHFDRDDLVQEAIVFVLEEAARRAAPLSVAWIVRRGRQGMNRAYRPFRRRYPERLAVDCEAGLDGKTPIDGALADDIVTYARGPLDRWEDLGPLMRRLPRRHRIVLVLRYGLDGRSVISRERIAKALGCCETTIDRIEAEAIEVLRWWTIEAEASAE